MGNPLFLLRKLSFIDRSIYTFILSAIVYVNCSVPSDSTMSQNILVPSIVPIEANDLECYELCGRGTDGRVHRARWKSKDKEVAIKKVLVLKEREVEILSLLNHRNIIQFYGAVITEPYCFVTEYAPKGSLYDFINNPENLMDFGQILNWSKDIALGMNYLHNEAPIRIIHRDLKSPNCVISAEGDIKLCDFGSSRKFDRTAEMTPIGTYCWMAPEVMKNQLISTYSDTFSYGVILWEMQKREVPFKDLEYFQVIWKVAENNERLTIPTTCPPGFSKLMQQCWETEPKDRPSFSKILLILEHMILEESLQENAAGEWRASEEIEKAIEKLNYRESELAEREEKMLKRERQFDIEKIMEKNKLSMQKQELTKKEHILEDEVQQRQRMLEEKEKELYKRLQQRQQEIELPLQEKQFRLCDFIVTKTM